MIEFYFDHITLLERISQFFSLAVPFILLVWFCYTQYQNYLKSYCKEIEGVYAGFVSSSRNLTDTKGLNGGIIMYIRDVDNKGFFNGEFRYRETKLTIQNSIPKTELLTDGLHTFLGKMNFRFYFDKIRHPLKPMENRSYKGKLYVIVRLDFQFETNKMEDYLLSEYDIIHLREMKVLKFTLKQTKRDLAQKLPNSFTLFKSRGFTFEPLSGVKDIIFTDLK
jgi:hypothetical protein